MLLCSLVSVEVIILHHFLRDVWDVYIVPEDILRRHCKCREELFPSIILLGFRLGACSAVLAVMQNLYCVAMLVTAGDEFSARSVQHSHSTEDRQITMPLEFLFISQDGKHTAALSPMCRARQCAYSASH